MSVCVCFFFFFFSIVGLKISLDDGRFFFFGSIIGLFRNRLFC